MLDFFPETNEIQVLTLDSTIIVVKNKRRSNTNAMKWEQGHN